MSGAIFVTGASGNVGRELLRACEASGLPTVSGATRPGPGARRFDFYDNTSWGPALEGCDRVFLLRPPHISDAKSSINPFIDFARARGVSHFTFVSVQGAEDRPYIPHHAIEQRLMLGSDWTILRPGFFAQNFADAYRRDLQEDRRLYVPAGAGRVAFIDLRDLGELAAQIFAAPQSFLRKAYPLTGPRAYTFYEAARILSAASGVEISYKEASIAGYAWHLLRHRKLPLMQVAVQAYLHVGLRRGDAEKVDPTLGQLLGRPARSLEDFLRDHASALCGLTPSG